MGRLDWGHWLLGLWAAIIGGGSGGVTAGLASMGIDPEHYNLTNGIKHTLTLMGAVFVVNAAISMFLYLKQSPVPQVREQWTPEQRAAHVAAQVQSGPAAAPPTA
jgi:hypothetical protein